MMRATWIRSLCSVAALVVMAQGCTCSKAGSKRRTIRFAYVKTLDQLPFFVAEKKGFFADEGVTVEHIALSTGPAAAAALSSDSADIGYSATMPLVMARQENLPFEAFAALDWERPPTDYTTVLLANERSGIASPKDLAGKTVAINTAGGQCELLVRVQLRKANVPYESVKIVNIPFPQMAAALEIGTVDALCAVDPFRTSILRSPAKPHVVGAGIQVDGAAPAPYVGTVLYAKSAWLKDHDQEVRALLRALNRAAAAIVHDGADARRTLSEATGIQMPVADAVRIGIGPDLAIDAAALQPVVDSAFVVGMIRAKMDAKAFTRALEHP
jgi:ABC-type nitrate/sulfonate/bicarbonate transport system substrate-binding protein